MRTVPIRRFPIPWLLLLLLTPASGFAAVERLQPEQGRWIDVAGSGAPFAAIFTPPSGTAGKGGVVLVPGHINHPDQPQVMGALRTGLAAAGWATLAIALPEDDAKTDPEAALPRIGAAIAYLRQQRIAPIVLIGHGRGASFAATYLASQPTGPVAGLVTLGWFEPADAEGPDSAAGALEKFTVPVYDLYGSRDLIAVSRQAATRLAAARRAARSYRQFIMEGADHDFTGLDQALVKRVRGWLKAEILRQSPTTPTQKARNP